MDIEVGMYWISKNRLVVGQIINIPKNEDYFEVKTKRSACLRVGYWNCSMKPSHNPIDLIKIGDYVNGCKVIAIDNKLHIQNTGIIIENNLYIPLENIDIKTIVTKERFESVMYKVGE